jgi:hypothetical protein
LGFQFLVGGAPWLGIVFILGVPPAAVAWAFEAHRRSAITSNPRAPESSPPYEQSELECARLPGEEVSIWIERVLAAHPDFERRVFEGYANNHPPAIGVPLAEWVQGWPQWNEDWDPAIAAKKDVFRAEDSITTWSQRNARRLSGLGLCDEEEMRSHLASMAEQVTPHIGEALDDYSARALARLREMKDSLASISTSTSGAADARST